MLIRAALGSNVPRGSISARISTVWRLPRLSKALDHRRTIKPSTRALNLVIMSAPASASAPVYILKWRMGPKERGRKHMAMFVPCPLYKNADPSAKDCPGTLFQVKGSPLAGFMHEIRPDWTRQKDNSTDFVHFLCHWEAQQTPDPKPNGALDQIALTVRPPGVSQPLWDAVSEFLSARQNHTD